MKRGLCILMAALMITIAFQAPAFAGYLEDAGDKTVKGVKNVTSSWWEVVMAMGDEDLAANMPIVLRQVCQFGAGLWNGVVRCAQGILELGCALIPNCEPKMMDPETLF